jgi:putative MATE family efflux protein
VSELDHPLDIPPAQQPIRGDLTQGPVAKTLLLFTLPTLSSNVLQSLNGSISAIYVGKFLGENAFAAAGISAMVMFLIFSSVFGLSMAATIMIGQAMGRRDIEEVRRTIGATAGTFIGISLLIALLGNFLVAPILHLLATPAAAFPFAASFLQVVFYGVPFVFLSVLLQSAMRGVGDAVTPLWSTVLNLVLSLVLNPIFILGLGPMPALGLPGAAMAGVVTNLCCLIFMIVRIYMLDLPIRLRGPELRLLWPDWAHLKPVLVIGLPMGLSVVVMSVSALVMTGLINREGVDTVAAYNAAQQLWNYIQMPAFAVGSAVSAMAPLGSDRAHCPHRGGRQCRYDRAFGAGHDVGWALFARIVLAGGQQGDRHRRTYQLADRLDLCANGHFNGDDFGRARQWCSSSAAHHPYLFGDHCAHGSWLRALPALWFRSDLVVVHGERNCLRAHGGGILSSWRLAQGPVC